VFVVLYIGHSKNMCPSVHMFYLSESSFSFVSSIFLREV
jgi:hypothetical protein